MQNYEYLRKYNLQKIKEVLINIYRYTEERRSNMASKGYGYQYETSPRKLEPEYQKAKVKKKKVAQKNVKKTTKKKNIKTAKPKTKKKFKLSFEARFFINSMLIFSVIFAIIACQALVEQRYKEKETLKQQYNDLLSKYNMISDRNDDVRRYASEYGMQTKSATLIDLGSGDYIESSVPQVKMQEKNIFEKISQWLEEIF